MKIVPLESGKSAKVSDKDYPRVRQYKWSAMWNGREWYAMCTSQLKGSRLLHRFILNAPKKLEVDHRDRNPLNCTRRNLRLATHIENAHNRGTDRDNKIGYKGVERNGSGGYQGRIYVRGKTICLGTYKTPEQAARAYDRAAKKYFGKFAKTNKMLGRI